MIHSVLEGKYTPLHAMFSTIRSFRHLLAGCACLSCLSVAAAQEESTPPAASQATPAAPKVITLEMHGDIKRHYLPLLGQNSFPYIFASEDTDYFLAMFSGGYLRFFVIPWESMCPTFIEQDRMDVILGGSDAGDDMSRQVCDLDLEKAVMYKNYFALYDFSDNIQFYRADGKRIASVREANTVRDKVSADNPEELPVYLELKQKIANGSIGPEAKVLQSNVIPPSVEKAWEEREAAGLYYTQENGKLIFHSAGQSSVVADISNKPILKEYQRNMTEDMSVFVWLCGSLAPVEGTEESYPHARKVQDQEWYIVFADASGKIVSEKTVPSTCDYPLDTYRKYRKCSEAKFTPQPLGDNVLLLSGIVDKKDRYRCYHYFEYAVISPEGKQIATLLSPCYIYAFPYKIRNSYLLFSSNYEPFTDSPCHGCCAAFIVLPCEDIDE